MVATTHHGGGCCGVRHIYGMDNTTIAQLDRDIAAVDMIPANGGGLQSGRLIEVILSSRQVGEQNPRGLGRHWAPCVTAAGGWPAVLADRGFRLVSRFENKNSGADCYIFHRVPHFKSLTELPFTWDHTATPPVRDAGGPGVAQRAVYDYQIGERIQYVNVNNSLNNQFATITNVRQGDDDRRYDLRFDNGSVRERYTAGYFRRVNIIDRPVVAAPAAPRPAPVTDVVTLYQNVFADGRMGGQYATLEVARASAPRCRRQDRIVYRSDGTNQRTNNV